jgi:hypothetical protein
MIMNGGGGGGGGGGSHFSVEEVARSIGWLGWLVGWLVGWSMVGSMTEYAVGTCFWCDDCGMVESKRSVCRMCVCVGGGLEDEARQ